MSSILEPACFSSPCQNSAKCKNNFDDYSCACLTGWTGRNCERPN